MRKRAWVILKSTKSWDWERTETVTVCHDETSARSIVGWLTRNLDIEKEENYISYHYEVCYDVEDLEEFMEVERR